MELGVHITKVDLDEGIPVPVEALVVHEECVIFSRLIFPVPAVIAAAKDPSFNIASVMYDACMN